MRSLFIIIITLLYASFANANGYSIAYSKKLGVEVFASGNQNSWCSKNPQLTLIADDNVFFKSDKASALLKKIGKGVIEKKCPQAVSMSITGIVKGATAQKLIGSASKSSDWVFSKKQAPNKITQLMDDAKESINSIQKKAAKAVTSIKQLFKTNPTTQATKKDTSGLFSVNGWAPKPEQGLVNTSALDILEIFNKEGTCKIMLHPAFPKVFEEHYFTQTGQGNAVCVNGYLEGYAYIRIYNARGQIKYETNAVYKKGIAYEDITNKLHFNKLLDMTIDSSAVGERSQFPPYEMKTHPNIYLLYYLGSNNERKVHFIGRNQWVTGGTTGPSGIVRSCGANNVLIITENESLFENNVIVHELTEEAVKYARKFCQKPFIIVTAGSTPYFEKGLVLFGGSSMYFTSILSVKDDGTVDINPAEKNFTIERKAKRITDAYVEYEKVEGMSFAERLASLHGVNKLDNPLKLFLTKLAREEKVEGSSFAHVDEVDGDVATIDWPVEMKLTNVLDQIENPGWFIFTGEVEIKDENTKGKFGYPVGAIDVSKVTACKQESCEEVRDTVQFIRSKYKLPDWQPPRMEGGQ